MFARSLFLVVNSIVWAYSASDALCLPGSVWPCVCVSMRLSGCAAVLLYCCVALLPFSDFLSMCMCVCVGGCTGVFVCVYLSTSLCFVCINHVVLRVCVCVCVRVCVCVCVYPASVSVSRGRVPVCV